MTFKVWVFNETGRENQFYKWRKNLPINQLAKLEEKLDKLGQVGLELLPVMLAPVGNTGLLKIKVQGNPKLRPILTRGPFDQNLEFTLLKGAKEISSKFSPPNALEIALENKRLLILDKDLRTEYVAT